MRERIWKNRRRIWYMLCFFALGIIDQRRNSAMGGVQMTAANCTGFVLAAMLLPSLDRTRFRRWQYLVWTIAGLLAGGAAIVWGWENWNSKGQWITAVLNLFVWGYLLLYFILERRSPGLCRKPRMLFWCMSAMFLIEALSASRNLQPLWELLIFGGFYLIGIREEHREDFFQGMLNGFILWFFIQQAVAFGFRPYDFVRYRGLYVGETQNGIFYMIVYCAFLCKWIWAREKGQRKVWVWGYFVMAAGSISFLIFTGGRSSLVGAAVATVSVYVIYDIVRQKRILQCLRHVLLFGLCVVVTFPLVYGCIRYLPTILHHPIWFEGEYNDDRSVRSFDPWNSERYVTLEKAMERDVGRILDMFHIHIGTEDKKADEQTETKAQETVSLDSITARKMIYKSYLQVLNLWGHRNNNPGFKFPNGRPMGHAHNMFLQISYFYGIVAGLLFLGNVLYCLFYFLRHAARRRSIQDLICLAFFAAVIFYGQTEMAVVKGTITWVLIYLLPYFAGMRQELPERAE